MLIVVSKDEVAVMQEQNAGMLRFWGLSFLFFGLAVGFVAFAMDGSEIPISAGLAGVGFMTAVVGSLMTFLSFTLWGEGDSRS